MFYKNGINVGELIQMCFVREIINQLVSSFMMWKVPKKKNYHFMMQNVLLIILGLMPAKITGDSREETVHTKISNTTFILTDIDPKSKITRRPTKIAHIPNVFRQSLVEKNSQKKKKNNRIFQPFNYKVKDFLGKFPLVTKHFVVAHFPSRSCENTLWKYGKLNLHESKKNPFNKAGHSKQRRQVEDIYITNTSDNENDKNVRPIIDASEIRNKTFETDNSVIFTLNGTLNTKSEVKLAEGEVTESSLIKGSTNSVGTIVSQIQEKGFSSVKNISNDMSKILHINQISATENSIVYVNSLETCIEGINKIVPLSDVDINDVDVKYKIYKAERYHTAHPNDNSKTPEEYFEIVNHRISTYDVYDFNISTTNTENVLGNASEMFLVGVNDARPAYVGSYENKMNYLTRALQNTTPTFSEPPNTGYNTLNASKSFALQEMRISEYIFTVKEEIQLSTKLFTRDNNIKTTSKFEYTEIIKIYKDDKQNMITYDDETRMTDEKKQMSIATESNFVIRSETMYGSTKIAEEDGLSTKYEQTILNVYLTERVLHKLTKFGVQYATKNSLTLGMSTSSFEEGYVKNISNSSPRNKEEKLMNEPENNIRKRDVFLNFERGQKKTEETAMNHKIGENKEGQEKIPKAKIIEKTIKTTEENNDIQTNSRKNSKFAWRDSHSKLTCKTMSNGYLLFGGFDECNTRSLLELDKGNDLPQTKSRHIVHTRCKDPPYKAVKKAITASSGPGWYLLHFPVEQIHHYPTTFRLKYKKKGDGKWRYTPFNKVVRLENGIPRVKPNYPCPYWTQNSMYCILVTDHIRIKDGQQHQDYEGEIETMGLAPKDSEWSESKLEYSPAKYRFNFRARNCDLEKNGSCPDIRGPKDERPFICPKNVLQNNETSNARQTNATKVTNNPQDTNETKTETNNATETNKTATGTNNTTKPMPEQTKKATTSKYIWTTKAELVGLQLPSTTTKSSRPKQKWKAGWYWLLLVIFAMALIVFIVTCICAKRDAYCREMRKIQVMRPCNFPGQLVLRAPPELIRLTCSRSVLDASPCSSTCSYDSICSCDHRSCSRSSGSFCPSTSACTHSAPCTHRCAPSCPKRPSTI